MHIGITVSFKYSVFSSGAAQTALALAELYSFLGYTCSFINVSSESWWTDIPSLQKRWKIVNAEDIGAEAPYDRILEVEVLTPAQRAQAACPCIWIVRKGPLFRDIESCVIPYPIAKRDLTGISESWLQDICTPDDIQYVELITRKPVRVVPFLWSALAIETFRKETKPPIWQQSYAKDKPVQVHICETNTSSASSCVIPLCIFGESVVQGTLDPHLKVHNGDHLVSSEYFQKNLWANIVGDIKGMEIADCFVGRQRIPDLASIPNTLLITHSRFTTIRPYQLDALWCGIPIVHNSVLLRDVSPDVARGFYPNNDIAAGCAAVESLKNWITEKELFTIRRNILHRFGILSEHVKGGWKEALEASTLAKPVLRITFTDMWENFNPAYNFFTLLLEAHGYTVLGSYGSTPCDLLIFGPFGSEWKSPQFAKIPKVHYTGENTPPVKHADVFLNLGYQMNTDPNYIRLPLWVLEVDWFQADAKIRNPIPISLEECMNVSEYADIRKRFCAFIVSNPSQPVRNQAFHTLCRYKPVDSAGRLYNTIGPELFAGLGGGGGERRKVDFLRQYKFCIAYENEASPGYITEKILHAKAAGCVPIYWGAPNLDVDFDVEGCIDARGLTAEELLVRVKEVDEDDSLWRRKAMVPAISAKKLRETEALLDTVAKRIIAKGAASEASEAASTVAASTVATKTHLGNTVFVTGCNARFVDSLLTHWLPAIFAQKNSSTNVQVHVYLMGVDAAARKRILDAFPVSLFDIPTEPAGFADSWNPQHFLWKLWLLRESVTKITAGYPVVYLDTGVMMCRWPVKWLNRVKEEGICILEDESQDNRHWCNPSFCKELRVTEGELGDQQIWAGAIAFIAGDAKAKNLFEAAWILGQNPAVIVGEKWSGLGADKKPYGHRHDQSILSIVSKRQGLPRFPLSEVYCHTSIRHTFMKGLSLYAHRGFFVVNDPIAMGIDTAWVINLDRRKDRMEKFLTNNEFLREKHMRFPAIDGTKLKLTPKIARLFASSHNISWRKGVMGCAISHMTLWQKLLDDKKEINTYLILEDDAVVNSELISLFNTMHEKLPADWDVIYLGGVLPPNREGFESSIEPVNEFLGRVKKNTLFHEKGSNYFHFCAYSYILRRSGAEKLMRICEEREGCWAPADHLICNAYDKLNIYFTNPLIAGCYQDTDPRYQASNFNTFGKEEYDSDLRNEDRFTDAEVCALPVVPLDIAGALKEASAPALVKTVVEAPAPAPAPVEAKPIREELFPLMYHDIDGLFEKKWLEFILGQTFETIRTRVPIIIYQHPYCDKLKEVLRTWPAFTLLHLSDDDCTDPIDIYDWPNCKGVVRNYVRPLRNQKVVTIPLGYHWSRNRMIQKRSLVWSFIGAEHGDRKEKLRAFKGLTPNTCIFQPGWNSIHAIGEDETLDTLEASMCVPCPGGVNYETFRIYEALEAGAVPILVDGDAAFLEYLKRWLPIVSSPDWATAARIVAGLAQRPEIYESYRNSLMDGWASMKRSAVEAARKTLGLRDTSSY
uniref:Uncharacterized protein n=1 Tax=viral metagenome TaxID=1070528 RepID=A0A6C0LA51_9ZZZZ